MEQLFFLGDAADVDEELRLGFLHYILATHPTKIVWGITVIVP